MTKAPNCNPVSTTGQLSADHSAHAVPGTYPPRIRPGTPDSYVDLDGDGFVDVSIDGSRSHTHFFDPKRNIAGAITRILWKDLSVFPHQNISRVFKFRRAFPVGVTRLSLTVVDNACNMHTAVTTVTVTPKHQPGAYCYYYPTLSKFPPPLTRSTPLSKKHMQFARVNPGLWFNVNSSPYRNLPYITRCFYSIPSTTRKQVKLTLSTKTTGRARLFHLINDKKVEQILHTGGPDSKQDASVSFVLQKGRTNFELQFSYSDTSVYPRFSVTVNNNHLGLNAISHDRSAVVPIIRALAPFSGHVLGGTRVKLIGYGLYPPMKIRFGSVLLSPLPSDDISTEAFVRSPKLPTSLSKVSVQVILSTGQKSNTLPFRLVSSACGTPAFEESELTALDGSSKLAFLSQPTTVVLGPDHRLYMGTLIGTVSVLSYNVTSLRATHYCTSEPYVDKSLPGKDGKPGAERAILGIAFNPNRNDARPYVTTSTLNAWSDERMPGDFKAAWHNGGVDRFRFSHKPALFPLAYNGKFSDDKNPPICLVHDKTLITGLPVGNGGSHSVNALHFTRDGDLLIAVGGATNMGLPSRKLGNIWESPLSGALLLAKLSKGNFNGSIPYVNPNARPHNAKLKQSYSDVSIFASGMRNMFTFTQTLAGDYFGIDQGPGCPLGGPATSCNDFDQKKADNWPLFNATRDWPSKARGSEPTCPGLRREDKLIRLERGRFYGHANLARGECMWIDPMTGKSALGAHPPSRLKYQGPMVMIPASATSVHEYNAKTFCGAMRGDLVVSTFRGISTWRIQLNSNRKRVSAQPELMSLKGGLSFVEDIHGNLIFPKLTKKEVFVLVPVAGRNEKSRMTLLGVWPRVHRRSGGSKLYVGGRQLTDRTKIYVDGAKCKALHLAKTRDYITCKMPKRSQVSADVVDVRIVGGGKEDVLKKAVAYMK